VDRLTDAQRARLSALVPGTDDERERAVMRSVEMLALGLRQDARLAGCDPFSVIVATASGLAAGLQPQFGQISGRTADYLVIPRGGQAVVQMTVAGWVTLLARAGWHVTGAAVYSEDAFDCDLATGILSHRPSMVVERGKVIGAWARFRRGAATHVELLTTGQMMQIRDASDAWKRQGDRSPWGQWPDRMAIKSCIARGARHLDLGDWSAAAGLGREGEGEP
jgi:recombinational DNA repair protein RecT